MDLFRGYFTVERHVGNKTIPLRHIYDDPCSSNLKGDSAGR